MNRTPAVSVLIPVYNGQRYLAAAIESVLGQSFRDFEVLVVDDGSRDRSRDVAWEWKRRDARVRVIAQNHEGKAAGLNRGIREARSKWVAMLDADDVCLPDRLEAQLAFASQHPSLVIVASHAWYIGERGRVLGVYRLGPTTPEEFHAVLGRGDVIHFLHSTTMVDRERVLDSGGYDDRFGPAEDLELYNRLADKGLMSLAIAEPKVGYRVHENSLMMATHFRAARMTRYTKAYVVARRGGKPLPTPEDFARLECEAPWTRRIRVRCNDISGLFYRRAGVEFGKGNAMRGTLNGIVASVMSPGYVFEKVLRQTLPFLSQRARRQMVEK
jgi:glycosyltransferase involved in cell wall biosynthesis